MVSDLAELSAVEASNVPVRRTDVDLAQVAHDELAVHDSQLRAAGLAVGSQLDGPVLVRADSDRLHQAVGNLLANAARYCRAGDEVTVLAHGEADQAVLDVVDSGPGIPVDELPHVFDRLWRGSAAKHVAGSGIGLAVAREIVVAHGGAISCEPRPGGGTVFSFQIAG